jgi:hypothetical protein
MDTPHTGTGGTDDGRVIRQSAVGSRQSTTSLRGVKRRSNPHLHPYPTPCIFHPPSSILYSLSSIFYLLFSILLLCQNTQAQVYLRQTIRGTVYDATTKGPLEGATVVLVNSDPLVGTTTDKSGNFRLDKVPVGKQQVKVSYVGYSPFISDVLSVLSGKETVLSVYLDEQVTTASEVEIKGDYRKYEAINKMATVSIRSFSVDETNRFAGSYGDPGRMVANFAGVTSGIDNRNDIIVRGNSPSGMQWRLDDLEIQNPNHFAAVGTTGGPVTILNDNMLTNSDFLTGSFPAQYGNTVAGIFDLRMRTGNNEKHEFWGQIGWNGLEFGAEGPFSKNSGASFIAAYRYSLLQLISYTGFPMEVVPEYQDLNFKITVPTKNAGTFSITGMGGFSYIELYDSRKPYGEWTFPEYGQNIANGSGLGLLGISNTCFLLPTIRLKTSLFVVGSYVKTGIDTFNVINRAPATWAGENSSEVKYSFSTQVLKKFSPKDNLETGFSADWFHMHFSDSIRVRGNFRMNTNSTEDMQFLRAWSQWQHRFNDRFYITPGLNYQYLTLNGSWALEPRIGCSWNVTDNHTLSLGAGIYSQMQPRVIYFVLAPQHSGASVQTNNDLGFTRSIQVDAGYNYLVTEDFRIKTDFYYQYLYDLPVKETIPEYSVINQGHEFFLDRQYADSLVNGGYGTNYGGEVTFEKFFSRNYFFLFSASLFNSEYAAWDNKSRSTAFNANYAFNAVGGYEFKIGKRKLGTMSFGLRATWSGGNPYVPYDEEETAATHQAAYDWANSFVPRYPDYKRFSFRFGVKRNRPKLTMEFLLDLQYRTNYTNISLQQIDVVTGRVYYFYTMEFFPMGTWRIQF